MRVLSLEEIQSGLDLSEAIRLLEEGFSLFSKGRVTVPPVGYMKMDEDFGEVHIKYGWVKGDEIFVVKVAGTYPQNESKVQGVILVFHAQTGAPIAILQDEGYLTNLRTAIAGLIAAKYLGPKDVSAIGVIGTGIQARLQADLLKHHTPCRNLLVWGRNHERVDAYIEDMTNKEFKVRQAVSPAEVCKECNLIVTTTSARRPLILANDVRPGTHITAVGADAPGKQELDPDIFKLADICAVDSKSQCIDHGEVFHAYKTGIVGKTDLVELGDVIASSSLRRKSPEQITVADLTGVGVQDIQIARAILGSHRGLM